MNVVCIARPVFFLEADAGNARYSLVTIVGQNLNFNYDARMPISVTF